MKAWIIVLLLLILTWPVGAEVLDTPQENNTTSVPEAVADYQLSVAAAIELGLQNNLDVVLARYRVDEAQADLDRQRIVGDDEAITAAEEHLAETLENLEQTKDDLATQIENSYYDILTAQGRLAELEQNYADSESSYRMDQARYQAGMISQLSLERSANALLNTELNVARQQDNVATSFYRFQDLLGIPLQKTVVLTDTIDLTYQAVSISFEEAMQKALLYADTIVRAQEGRADAAEAVRLADNSYTPRAALEKALLDQQRAEVNYEKATNRVFFEIRTAYLRVTQLEASLELLRRELDYAERNLLVVQAQHADGVVSDTALLNAERAVESAEGELSDALWDHVRARRDLQIAIGQPSLQWGD